MSIRLTLIKKGIAIALCLSLCTGAFVMNGSAQVQIQTTLPSSGLVQKNQLWNLVVVNSSINTLLGRLEMTLIDRQTSQELMTASTGEIELVKGVNILNSNKLNPIQYNYIGVEPDRGFNSLLPAGTYSVCYAFAVNPESKKTIIAEECIAFDIEPLTPPMLIFPADSSILEIPPTQFTWTPPAPIGMLHDVRYDVIITEVLPNQKAVEAIEQNPSFFNTRTSPNNYLGYSAAYPKFEKDKWYAWQIISRDKNNYAAKTDAWVFKVANPNPIPPALNSMAYVELKMSASEKTIAPNGYLRFHYFNQLGDSAVNVMISNISVNAKLTTESFSLSVVRGQNFIQKDLTRRMKMQEGHVYMLTLENSAGEKWFVQFEVKKY
jgi:hypothetical protein